LQWKSNKYYSFRRGLFVPSGTQREMRMRHIVIGGLSASTIFFFTFSHKKED
jgi:hypothetical protein